MPRVILAAALLAPVAAQSTVGQWQTFAGYQTASDVQQHAQIDLDMEEFEAKVGEYATNTAWITEAMAIFDNGGNGVCATADENGIGCAVGGAKGNSLKSSSIRTLKGFAQKDFAGIVAALGDKYAEQLPPIYTAYWTAHGMTAAEAAMWSDTFVRKDYSAIAKPAGSNQLMKKGANYQTVWMYVLHELEDAIGDCYAGDITANDNTPTGGAPHAWDEGWAFYAGSQVAATAAGAVTDDGTLIWELSEKRADDFGTDDTSGPASVNVQLLAKFIEGRDKIIAADCAGAEPLVEDIRKLMTVPLVQGTLKYAFKADPANSAGDCTADASNTAMTAADGCVKSWSEGWAFAAAVLPQVYNCDQTAAATIKTNLDIAASGPMAGGFAAVKSAIEGTYQCLGITCAHVGKYSTTTACTDPAASSDAATAPALALGAAAAAAGAAFLL